MLDSTTRAGQLLIQSLVQTRTQLWCQTSIGIPGGEQQAASHSPACQTADSSEPGQTASFKSAKPPGSKGSGLLATKGRPGGNRKQGVHQRQRLQVPASLQSGLTYLLICNDLDLNCTPVTIAIVAELCALQQLASQLPSPELSSIAVPAADYSNHSAACARFNRDQQIAVRDEHSSETKLSMASRASAAALAKFLLDEVFTVREHPIQHAHVLAAAAVRDGQMEGHACLLQLGRMKQAAALLDKAISLVSPQSLFSKGTKGHMDHVAWVLYGGVCQLCPTVKTPANCVGQLANG